MNNQNNQSKQQHYLFTSEVVSPGHPDKCADIIADAIVDKLIIEDSNSRVASEVFLAGKNIIVGGEVTTKAKIANEQYIQIVKETLEKIGYFDNPYFTKEECLHPEDLNIQILLNKQSPDINQGVDRKDGEIGAGDQGIMFGYADIETKEYMPSAITYARQIMETVYNYALKNPNHLGVDIKTQVTMDYETKENFENCNPKRIHTIVVSAPCVSSMPIEEVRNLIYNLIIQTNLPSHLFHINNCIFHINPTGKYVSHSSLHDSGLTGRKLIVDTFGGYAPIGGGAQSSKDYTKVDRSGLYAARWIAKNIVAHGIAKKCLVQISYAIGVAKPTSIAIDCYGTNILENIDDNLLSSYILDNIPLTPKWITKKFGLDKPSNKTFLYSNVAARGQVGQNDYPWEKIDNKTNIFTNILLQNKTLNNKIVEILEELAKNNKNDNEITNFLITPSVRKELKELIKEIKSK
jgi:S-adenosylmethionine synthetase